MTPTSLENTKKQVTKDKINGLGKLAGSAKLEEKVDVQEILREIRGK